MTFDEKLDEYMRAIYDCGYTAGEAGLKDTEALPEVLEVAREAIRGLLKKAYIDGGIGALTDRQP